MNKRILKNGLTGLLCIVLLLTNILSVGMEVTATELDSTILDVVENLNDDNNEDTEEIIENDGQEEDSNLEESDDSGFQNDDNNQENSDSENENRDEEIENKENEEIDNSEEESEEIENDIDEMLDEDDEILEESEELKEEAEIATVATEEETLSEISGQCGDNLTWVLEDGTLTISGTGAMDDYIEGSQPWYIYLDDIKSLIINDGVSNIGENAFYNCYNSSGELVMPDSVIKIGASAFRFCHGLEGDLVIPENVTDIGDNAFDGCDKLSGIAYIPKSVLNIGVNAFSSIHTIYGEAGSCAETYSLSNNISFIEINVDAMNISEITPTDISVETAEDLLKISNDVSQGISDYAGCVIHIKSDIDLRGVSWKPIGNTGEHPFRGSIQGNGFKISGMQCGEERSGLIGYWNVNNECYVMAA